MVSPTYWFFFYDSGKQIVYDVRHVAQGFPLIQNGPTVPPREAWLYALETGKNWKNPIPLLEEREPELRQLIPLYRTDLQNKTSKGILVYCYKYALSTPYS
jgi:hypothetical protein